MIDFITHQTDLRHELTGVLHSLNTSLDNLKFDVIITNSEVNNHSEVGCIVQNIFRDDQNIISLRTSNLFDGIQDFGILNYHLPVNQTSTLSISTLLQKIFALKKPKHLLVIPQTTKEYALTMILREIFTMDMCIYMITEPNISLNTLPKDSIKELLELSVLRFGITKDICDKFVEKFGFSFNLLPKVYDDNTFAQLNSNIKQELAKTINLLDHHDLTKVETENIIYKTYSSCGVSQWLWNSVDAKKTIFKRFGYSKGYYTDASLIITCDEINDMHGTGVLLQRIFKERTKLVSLRSRDNFQGNHEFAHSNMTFSSEGFSDEDLKNKLLIRFKDILITKILCVPYSQDEIRTAITLKKIFNVPLCTWIMDDQNIVKNNIPDEIIEELLTLSELRLGISTEICDAYYKKYHKTFQWMPPLVDENYIQKELVEADQELLDCRHGILIGNIWEQQWLDKLQTLMGKSKASIEWHGNPNRSWLYFDESILESNNIFFKGFNPNEECLIHILRNAPFAIIPIGSNDDARPEITQLSLPSRIPYILATANTPILVIGSKDSAAANFVLKNEIGLVCEYELDAFNNALDFICNKTNQNNFRKNALKYGKNLSVKEVDEWIWKSTEAGEAITSRFVFKNY